MDDLSLIDAIDSYASDEIVAALISSGANLHEVDDNYHDVLMNAVVHTRRRGNNNIVNMLLDAGVDVNQQYYPADMQTASYWNRRYVGYTALMNAARFSAVGGTEETVRLLIARGADVNLKTVDGLTALMYAAANTKKDSTEDTVRLLIDYGADVNAVDSDGYTALHIVARAVNSTSTLETLKILLRAGANPNIMDKDGYTPLMWASHFCVNVSSPEAVKCLLDAGANTKLTNKRDETALYLAYRARTYHTGQTIDVFLAERTIDYLLSC